MSEFYVAGQIVLGILPSAVVFLVVLSFLVLGVIVMGRLSQRINIVLKTINDVNISDNTDSNAMVNTIPMSVRYANNCSFYSQKDEGLVTVRHGQSAGNPSGRFNGGGLGNKLFVYTDDFGGMSLADLVSISIQLRVPKPYSDTLQAGQFYMNIFVKSDNTTTTWNNPGDSILVVDNLFTNSIASSNGDWITVSFTVNDSVWAIITPPPFPPKYGLPSFTNSNRAPLTDYTKINSPIFKGLCTDGGIPKDSTVAGIAFANGGSSSLNTYVVNIATVTITTTSAVRRYKFS